MKPNPGTRGVLALTSIALVILLVAVVLVWRDRGESPPAKPEEAAAASGSAGTPGAAPAPAPSGAERGSGEPRSTAKTGSARADVPEDTNEIRELTPEQARRLVLRRQAGLSLNGLTTLSDDVAMVLGGAVPLCRSTA